MNTDILMLFSSFDFIIYYVYLGHVLTTLHIFTSMFMSYLCRKKYK